MKSRSNFHNLAGKLGVAILIITTSGSAYSQMIDSVKTQLSVITGIENLRKEQAKYGKGKISYVDSSLGYEIKVPDWLNLKPTGSLYVFGGTLPPVDGIENAIAIKSFAKSQFSSVQDFRKYIVEDAVLGQTPKWATTHKLLSKKALGLYEDIGESYKVQLLNQGLIYHCQYVLTETQTAYVWIDFTSTQETFDKNFDMFEDFLSGFSILAN